MLADHISPASVPTKRLLALQMQVPRIESRMNGRLHDLVSPRRSAIRVLDCRCHMSPRLIADLEQASQQTFSTAAHDLLACKLQDAGHPPSRQQGCLYMPFSGTNAARCCSLLPDLVQVIGPMDPVHVVVQSMILSRHLTSCEKTVSFHQVRATRVKSR